MLKVVAVVVGGVFLSGCALPVPLQIASWALDGFSLLATQKSITDHGLSIVAQQDCALWRGVTEGAVCREDDPMTILVEQGDVIDGNDTVETGSALTSVQTMLVARPTEQNHTVQASWQVQPKTTEVADGGVQENQQASLPVDQAENITVSVAPVSEETAEPQWQMVSQEPASIASNIDGMTSYNADPGDYFVIGSFGVWENAKRFAESYPSLNAQILAANVVDYRVFRIVIGPYNDGNQRFLRENIREAKIEDIWAVRVPVDETTVAWRASASSSELAAIPESN